MAVQKDKIDLSFMQSLIQKLKDLGLLKVKS